jgi:hypothetical protein
LVPGPGTRSGDPRPGVWDCRHFRAEVAFLLENGHAHDADDVGYDARDEYAIGGERDQGGDGGSPFSGYAPGASWSRRGWRRKSASQAFVSSSLVTRCVVVFSVTSPWRCPEDAHCRCAAAVLALFCRYCRRPGTLKWAAGASRRGAWAAGVRSARPADSMALACSCPWAPGRFSDRVRAARVACAGGAGRGDPRRGDVGQLCPARAAAPPRNFMPGCARPDQ